MYYRDCWHIVSRYLFKWYRQTNIISSASHSSQIKELYNLLRPSSFTRHCSIRLSPIVKNSLLLPPVGVWAVSQSHCGYSTSQHNYTSSPWWAITLTNQLICRTLILQRSKRTFKMFLMRQYICYAVLANLSTSYPPLQGRLDTCYSPVRL